MATDETVDIQFEQAIIDTLRSMSNGSMTILKENNQIIQMHVHETNSSGAAEKRKPLRKHLSLISDKDAG